MASAAVGLNEDLFHALNGAGNPALDPVMVALSVLGMSVLTFLWAVPLWLARRRREAVDLLLLLAVAEILVFVLKVTLAVPRPTIGTILAVPLDDVSASAFPSGHATRAFAVALFLSLRLRDWRWGVPLFAYAALVAVSRVYVGVHWPSDILAGAVLGLAWAFEFERFTRLPAYAVRRDGLLERLAPRRQGPA